MGTPHGDSLGTIAPWGHHMGTPHGDSLSAIAPLGQPHGDTTWGQPCGDSPSGTVAGGKPLRCHPQGRHVGTIPWGQPWWLSHLLHSHPHGTGDIQPPSPHPCSCSPRDSTQPCSSPPQVSVPQFPQSHHCDHPMSPVATHSHPGQAGRSPWGRPCCWGAAKGAERWGGVSRGAGVPLASLPARSSPPSSAWPPPQPVPQCQSLTLKSCSRRRWPPLTRSLHGPSSPEVLLPSWPSSPRSPPPPRWGCRQRRL